MKPMVRLIARKPLKYGTRRLQAGDEFDATPAHAQIWIKLRMAEKPPRKVGKIDPPPPSLARQVRRVAPKPVTPTPVPAPEPEADESAADDAVALRAALRVEYENTVGRRPFMGWTADVLREKIAEFSSKGEG